jgi:hypothetical protein
MESFIVEKSKMGTLFKKIIAFNNLDDEEKEIDEKTKNKLIEIKDILFDVIEEIDEAISSRYNVTLHWRFISDVFTA